MDGQSQDAAREGDTQASGESYIPDKTLYMVARKLGPGWKKLALVLGFSVIQVRTIETDHPKDTERQGLDMLSNWKQAQPIGSEQQMTRLRAALENIGRADICQESSISDETLCIVARSLGRGWVRLAVEELGFTLIQVQTIETDCPNDIERQGLHMLAQWKQAQPTSFEQHITTLRAALEKIGRADIFLKFPTVKIETNAPWMDMKTVRTTRNWDTRHQVSAFAAGFDGVLEQVNDGSVIFVVRIMSREGLDRLWRMYTTGELAKKLTEILITDELKTEDKSDFAIQATIPKSDYAQACGFFDELEKDQRKEFPTVSIETDASWKRTKIARATGYPRMDTAHSYDWEGQDYTRHQVSAVIESCNGVLEQGNPGSETFVVRIMSREGLEKLWRMYTTGELTKKLTEILSTGKRTIQSTIPDSNYNQACRFFDKLEKDQRKDEECSIGMTDVEHKELGESSPAKTASSSNPAEHPVERSAENIERLHTTTDGDDSSSMMEVEHKQRRKSSPATTSYSSDPAEHSEARWTNREEILHTITDEEDSSSMMEVDQKQLGESSNSKTASSSDPDEAKRMKILHATTAAYEFDDEMLENVANSLGQAWRTVATYLSFDDGDCQPIIEAHPGHISQQALQMLTAWRAGYAGADILAELKEALRAVGLHTLLHELGEEILETPTLQKVAKSVDEEWPQLALYLSFDVEQCQHIQAAFPTTKEQAGQMIAAWRQTFNGDNPVEYLATALIAIGCDDLARELAPHQKLPKCHCDNNKPLKYRPYYSKGEDGGSRLLGICCTNCGQEWLEGRFLLHPDEDNTRPSVKLRGVLLKNQLEVPIESNLAFQVKGSRTKIENLKVGDHITWHRHWGYWHHAIVSEIGGVGGRVKDIQWCKSGCGVIKIKEKWLELSQEEGELYRIDYEKTITEVNTPELVIARARSRLDDTGYGLFSDNCEAFASYCKTGLSESWQVVWLYQKVKSVVMEALTNAITGFAKVGFTIVAKEYAKEGAKVFLEQETRAAAKKVVAAETLERLARGIDAVGAGIIIFFEGCACLYNLDQIYENRKKGDISRQDFIASAFKRVSEAVLGAGLAVGGGIACWKYAGAAAGTLFMPGLGTAVGAFIGSIVGGVIGSTLGRYIGVSVGSPIGLALAITIGTNDRAVKNIGDLKPGDQVVFFGNLLHPRHHAIVVDCYPLKGKVRVIHNTYQNGVVEELVDFSKPVYRLEYDKECYPPDEVIKRARSKIGDETYKYILAFNNCKSFGRWCKVK